MHKRNFSLGLALLPFAPPARGRTATPTRSRPRQKRSKSPGASPVRLLIRNDGKTGRIVWHFNCAGEFDFACLIAGHYQAGMVGKITVAPA